MDFSDSQHNLAELAFQGSEELDLVENCREEVIEALTGWRGRADHTASGAELLHVDDCAVFSISYEGNADEYWPDEADNDISETFVREFLYHDGICNITDERVRLLHVKYSIMALTGDEYLLVCPYLTDANNISGIVVVCVTKMLSQD
jgi:hypothetical protein